MATEREHAVGLASDDGADRFCLLATPCLMIAAQQSDAAARARYAYMRVLRRSSEVRRYVITAVAR